MSKTYHQSLGREYYSIVVAQYKTKGFGAGDEENLDWALGVLVDEPKVDGRVYHAMPGPPQLEWHGSGGDVAWTVSTADKVSFTESPRCLGGVRIGTITRDELTEFEMRVLGVDPRLKSGEWTSRDWVTECILVMQNRGWVPLGVEHGLLPLLRRASSLTEQDGLRPALITFPGL
ncbi:hypothetical protein OH77DRAFT_1402977 [Trametes cingulata]|nr:hypothetical protein OH77DRAFT_1402977 [Trametes cingulata]